MEYYGNSNLVLLDFTEENRNPILVCHSYIYVHPALIYPFNPERDLVVWTTVMGFNLIRNPLISHTLIPVNPVNFLIYTNIK